MEFVIGSSVVITKDHVIYSEADDVSLRFRTTKPKATLFTTTSSLSANNFQLKLINGKMAVCIRIKGNQQVLRLRNIPVNNIKNILMNDIKKYTYINNIKKYTYK